MSINISTTAKDDIVSLTVRPWFDMVEDIRSQVCSIDTPSQRQQLFLGSKRLHEDGRVLALHGVVAGSTVHLVNYLSSSKDRVLSQCLVECYSSDEQVPGACVVSRGITCRSSQ